MLPLDGLLLGLAHGVRHAFEPDHLAAVSTMVTGAEERRAPLRYATSWGLGHAAMLVGVGGALFLLRGELPAPLAVAFELVVAGMLIALGIRSIRAAARTDGPLHTHAHDGATHTHGGAEDHLHLPALAHLPLARLPFVVGLVHGLAGSGAMAALVASHAPTVASGLGLLVVYAAGSVLGMALLGGVLGAPLARLAALPKVRGALVAGSGLLSIGVGVAWGLAVTR